MLTRICALVLASILSLQAMQRPETRELVEAAQQAEKQNDPQRAIELYSEMLRIRPHWVSAEFHLALAYDLEQRYPEAIALLTEIIQHDPAVPDAYLLRGKDYYETNQYQKALQSLNLAAKLEPDNQQVHFYLGATYYQLKEYSRAASAFLEQIRIQPLEGDLFFQLIQSYQALQTTALKRINQNHQAGYFPLLLEAEKILQRGDIPGAESQIRAALAESPGSPEAWLLLSRINSQRGNQESARSDLEKAVRRETKLPSQFRGLIISEARPASACVPGQPLAAALCKATHGQFSQSMKLMQIAIREDTGDPRTLYWTARIYQRLADRAIVRLSQIAPDSSGLHKLYARSFSQSGRMQDATSEYAKAIAADNNDASTFIEYGNLKFKGQNFPEAIRLFQRALQLTPYDFNVHGLLAQAYVQNEEPALAAPYFRQVLQVTPENSQLRIDLAECLYAVERAPEAISILEAAPADPDGRIAYVLAKYYARQGEKSKAAQALKHFQQRQSAAAK